MAQQQDNLFQPVEERSHSAYSETVKAHQQAFTTAVQVVRRVAVIKNSTHMASVNTVVPEENKPAELCKVEFRKSNAYDVKTDVVAPESTKNVTSTPETVSVS